MINVPLIQRKLGEVRTSLAHETGFAAALAWVLEEAGVSPQGEAAAEPAPTVPPPPPQPKKLPRPKTPLTKYVLAMIDKAPGPLTPLEICNELKARGVTISEEECLQILRRLVSAGLIKDEGPGFENSPEGETPGGTGS